MVIKYCFKSKYILVPNETNTLFFYLPLLIDEEIMIRLLKILLFIEM